MHPGGHDPALTVTLALVAGILAQAAARHLRLPGIVLLLAAGVALGPDALGWIRPETLGSGLHTLVGLAVAVILFEGGMNLNLARLRREARSIRRLVTLGAVVTAAGGAFAARLLLDWPWTVAVLFGTLVIVTGPTVITPLLRRIRVARNVATVLEAEGVLVDAVGALIAVIALEIAISPSGRALALAPWDFATRFGLGVLLGAVGGVLLALLLRIEWLVPEGLENVLALSAALALFQASNVLRPESGIVSVIAAGFVVGNVRTRALPDLKEFKEQLTVLMIGMLFVLLAADVRLEQVRALGWPGLGTVLALMLIVRPLNVLLCTRGTELGWREKTFLSWLAPRGIVAAAVSSLAAQSLGNAGIPGGPELRALVFLVIAVTVFVQGLTGGLVADWLSLRRPSHAGYAILGAHALARQLATLLQESGEEVVLLESNPDACRAAQEQGHRVLFGDGLGEAMLLRAELDARSGAIGLTGNDALNFIFARKSRQEYRVPRCWVALHSGHASVTPAMVQELGARVLFGRPRPLDLWILRSERGLARLERWVRVGEEALDAPALQRWHRELDSVVLPLAVRRGGRLAPWDDDTEVRPGTEVLALVLEERLPQAHRWFEENAFAPAEAAEPTAP